jgi:ribosome-binding protein aMBF1 (putative translation factor)
MKRVVWHCRTCGGLTPKKMRVRVYGRAYTVCQPCGWKIRLAVQLRRAKVDKSMNKRVEYPKSLNGMGAYGDSAGNAWDMLQAPGHGSQRKP